MVSQDHQDTRRHSEFRQSLYVVLVSLAGTRVLSRTFLDRQGKSEIWCVFP